MSKSLTAFWIGALLLMAGAYYYQLMRIGDRIDRLRTVETAQIAIKDHQLSECHSKLDESRK